MRSVLLALLVIVLAPTRAVAAAPLPFVADDAAAARAQAAARKLPLFVEAWAPW
ncbi:MAG: hypothetical protein JWN44_6998 [Myxococcales bacterium]|nr:hypothetical protein [Myxococcales bacterium]